MTSPPRAKPEENKKKRKGREKHENSPYYSDISLSLLSNPLYSFINILVMYKMTVGKGVVYTYEAYEAK